MEAEDLSRAREMVQMILRGWDFMTWNEVLSDDVVLTLRTEGSNSARSPIRLLLMEVDSFSGAPTSREC
jgi:hypothetical protein